MVSRISSPTRPERKTAGTPIRFSNRTAMEGLGRTRFRAGVGEPGVTVDRGAVEAACFALVVFASVLAPCEEG